MKRTKPVNLTTHERTLILLYRLASPEQQMSIDAAAWNNPFSDRAAGRFGAQCSALALTHHSTRILNPFMAAHTKAAGWERVR